MLISWGYKDKTQTKKQEYEKEKEMMVSRWDTHENVVTSSWHPWHY